MNLILEQQLKQLPTEPGIYKYYNINNEIIYVGKAVNLKNRVKSYFVDKDIAPRTKILVSQIHHLEFIVVQSEMDALILEANLIKEHRPRFNIILKDDKSHLYIKITLHQDWPRISTCRATDIHLDPKATYFGPFPSGRIVKDTLRSLRRVFPYIAHNQPSVEGRRRPPQSYFYYNLPLTNQTEAPDIKEYRKQIYQLIYFLEGKRLKVVNELEKSMKQAAKQLNFELAGQIKRQLDGMSYVTQKTISPESYVANPDLIADKRLQAVKELAGILATYWPKIKSDSQQEQSTINISNVELEDLEMTQVPLQRIECFDISNISGQYAVGSMVVFINGDASKSDYRKFRIKREQAPNDVAMMTEILNRRFKRLKKSNTGVKDSIVDDSFSQFPDLVIVDGGKSQLSAAVAVLSESKLDIPVVGMTKREEELVLPIKNQAGTASALQPNSAISITNVKKPKRSSAHGAVAQNQEDTQNLILNQENYTSIRIARGSEALFLIQRIRDEAHRFAITYHRKLRAKGFLPS